MAKMEPREAVRALEALAKVAPGDPEAAHARADEILLSVVPVSVRNAYRDLERACPWWASA